MPVKIRLQRHGKKGKPFYHIVAADARAPRDGRCIERIGTYNPNTNPATIDMNVDSAMRWLQNGAVPTDTVRALLSYKGVMYKNHLAKGVAKGALTQEAADKKFDVWVEGKSKVVDSKVEGLASAEEASKAKSLAAEKAISDSRAKEIAAKNSPMVEEVVVESTPEEVTEEVATEEVIAEETPAVEEVTEAPAEEAPKKTEE